MMEVHFDDLTVEIYEDVFSVFKSYEQTEGKKESGGILLGGFVPDENRYVITIASIPSPRDRHGFTFFVRNKNSAQEIINTWWNQSGGTINYLGEWHTHGCEMPYPSFVDKQLLKYIAKDRSNVWPLYFMIIVGQQNTYYLGIADAQKKGKIVAEIQFSGGR